MPVFLLSSCDIRIWYFIFFGKGTPWHKVKGFLQDSLKRSFFQYCVPFFTLIIFTSLPLSAFRSLLATKQLLGLHIQLHARQSFGIILDLYWWFAAIQSQIKSYFTSSFRIVHRRKESNQRKFGLLRAADCAYHPPCSST